MILLPPRRIGSARVGERLGEGGMAFVFRAEDMVHPGREYAVKLLRPEVHGDADLVRRFLREGEVLAALKHPHLVEVHSFGKAGSWPYLLLELLPGGSVSACRGEAPARIAERLLGPMDALATAHAAGIVHRDLKPSNLLFAADGRLKVTDFGVCMWEGGEGTRLTRSQMVVGTVGFMAPEQHGDPRRVDARADVYALGAILYEFATGQAYARIQLPPASARPGFPPGLARILVDALAPDLARRLPSMAAFEGRLAAWLETAEAAGWGSEPLPGLLPLGEVRTAARVKAPPADDDPQARLGPYLDAVGTGSVGSRRSAAEGLLAATRDGDGDYLLAALGAVPEASRFAVAQALGKAGQGPALEPLLDLLSSPYCRREAAEAAARIALRTGDVPRVLAALREPGLGDTSRWAARAVLGDDAWAQALVQAWAGLNTSLRPQALEAARELPEALRRVVKTATAGVSGAAGEAWALL